MLCPNLKNASHVVYGGLEGTKTQSDSYIHVKGVMTEKPNVPFIFDNRRGHCMLRGVIWCFFKQHYLCIWCNRIWLTCFSVQKHIIFQRLYIIVGPLCPAALKRLIFYKSLLPTSTVYSDWPTAQLIEIGRTPQALIGIVTHLAIIASFSFPN